MVFAFNWHEVIMILKDIIITLRYFRYFPFFKIITKKITIDSIQKGMQRESKHVTAKSMKQLKVLREGKHIYKQNKTTKRKHLVEWKCHVRNG